ncbi:unnamed protein product [Phytomonas sp. EM1]|nr:unnamed protein product [Phytomonas sp. EM1]|eukprot:CCW64803.1 unnamed protein product [Phytomonas sp. isolate EM1]
MSNAVRASQQRVSTSGLRQLGVSMDDSAIFIEDTIDRTTAQCISASPSAVSFLSPQRLPTPQSHLDVTAYDPSHLGGLHLTNAKTPNDAARAASKPRGPSTPAASCESTAGDGCAVRLGFATSPTPLKSRGQVPRASPWASLLHGTPRLRSSSPSTRMPEPMVPLSELERVEKERNRYEKMYEHQKSLYEDMANMHAKTYRALQAKIIDVVALSSRNEESKRYIRQLKKEMSESRTRVIDIQNKVLEEARAERDAKSRYEALIEDQTRKYEHMAERSEDALIGIESFIQDLTQMNLEEDKLHVSQLDTLLRAAYTKNTSLLRDLMRQNCQIDLLFGSKDYLERQVDQLRREKRELEKTLADERRHMMHETERFIEQIEEQQQSILSLRQILIRTMDSTAQAEPSPKGSRSPCPSLDIEPTAAKFRVSPIESQKTVTRISCEVANLFSNSVRIQNSVGRLPAAHTTQGSEDGINGPLSTSDKGVGDLFRPPSVDMAAMRMTIASRKQIGVSSSVLSSPGTLSSEDNSEAAETIILSNSLEPHSTYNPSEILTVSKPSQEASEAMRDKQLGHSPASGGLDTTTEAHMWKQKLGAGSEGHQKENTDPSHSALKYQAPSKKSNAKSKPDAKGLCPRLASRATLRTLMQRYNKCAESHTRCDLGLSDSSSK